MSAELEAAEMTVRLAFQGATEVIRFIPNATITIAQIVSRIVAQQKLRNSKGASDLINGTNGAVWFSVPDENKEALVKQLRKWKMPFADVDALPEDGMFDFCIKAENAPMVSKLLERMGVNNIRMISDAVVTDGTVQVDRPFDIWAEEMRSGVQNIDQALNRRVDNLDTARATPYVIADRLNPRNFVVVEPKVDIDENGKEYVASIYSCYKENKKVGETNDYKNGGAGGDWKQKKETILQLTGMSRDDLVYFPARGEHQLYLDAFGGLQNGTRAVENPTLTTDEAIVETPTTEAKSDKPLTILPKETPVNMERYASDEEYRETVNHSISHFYNEEVKKYFIDAKVENPTIAQAPTKDFALGLETSKTDQLEIGLMAEIEALKQGSSYIATSIPEMEKELISLADQYASSGNPELTKALAELGNDIHIFRSSKNEIDRLVEESGSLPSKELSDKITILQERHDFYRQIYIDRRKYIDALISKDSSAIDRASSSIEITKKALAIFNEEPSKGSASAWKKLTEQQLGGKIFDSVKNVDPRKI